MYAIVLTFDQQIQFARLVVESYSRLWPDCSFTYRIPYNEEFPDALASRPDVELVRTKRDIRATMETLLTGIEDEEFVFWAIDDRYPVRLVDTGVLEQILAFVSQSPTDIDGVKLTNHAVKVLSDQVQVIGETRFRLQVDFPGGFYKHHFVRSKVLKRCFLGFDLPSDYSIRRFHEKLLAVTEWNDRVLVPERPVAYFGESCRRGRMTVNCLCDLRRHNLNAPDIACIDKIIVYGDAGRRISSWTYKLELMRRSSIGKWVRRLRRSILGDTKR